MRAHAIPTRLVGKRLSLRGKRLRFVSGFAPAVFRNGHPSGYTSSWPPAHIRLAGCGLPKNFYWCILACIELLVRESMAGERPVSSEM